MRRLILVAATALAAVTAGAALSQDAKMSFFVTSVGSGKGADLGGLKGADAHCASLAEAAGVKGKTWHAYLSTSAEDARDRVGKGPWVNAKGVKIADDVASLHGDANAISKETALNEKGEVVNGRGDKPNRHDVLTGSKPDGTKIADQTCGDWTMSGAEGVAMMGHHDRTGLDDSAAAKSWNSSHASRGGCSQEALKGTGGDGLFYCFAVE
ncbi:hypothetical protein RFN25_10470 [Mesorhizobium abyssinicae]|uniref:hypothetical protein n=1 Tax=Mesorhizobium abyssinicae TaxID=1209958 RepID=UPI002A2457AD|nr:hypothetical protein [Mesorhizobium abyssinicae]MDX8433859.1 hypothetical protein [Mesorhizobium abyssinicae]